MSEYESKYQQDWEDFIKQFALSQKQVDQFKQYLKLLVAESKKINLTAISSVSNIIPYHFADSLMIGEFIDFGLYRAICDVGTGGGFPGIPIKIAYPNIRLLLIEVNHKKIRFLRKVIAQLGLEDVDICDLDWRTFLRKTDYDIDIFFARASLRPDELIRAFSPICPYNSSTIIYWASKQWEPSKKELSFIKKQELYTIKNKKRKFVFLCRS